MDNLIDRLADGVVRHRRAVLLCFGAALLLSLVLLLFVGVNYDLASYLPADSETRRAVGVMDEQFGYPTSAELMVRDISIAGALALKERLSAVGGVKNVLWLDDVADVRVPLALQDGALTERYYRDGTARFQLEFWENGFRDATARAVDELAVLTGEYDAVLAGEALSQKQLLETTTSEIGLVALIAVLLIIGLLSLATTSWLEPALFLAVIGVAIGINMGTDLIFGSVSYITRSTEGLLQLAVSIDYSLFLFHRFREEREKHADPGVAMSKAVRKSMTTLAASSLTTIAGFAALTFMRYGLGRDLGFALLKGVAISLICVVCLLPALGLVFLKPLDKLTHRSLLPKMEGGLRHILKLRHVLTPLLLILAVPLFLGMRHNSFLYGDAGLNESDSPAAVAQHSIEQVFGAFHPTVVLVPAGDVPAEIALCGRLRDKPYVREVQALATLADPSIPREMLPAGLVETFLSGTYARIVLNTTLSGESEATFADVADLRRTVSEFYPDGAFVAGEATSVADIKDIVERDFPIVTVISILAVALIILVAFRSLSMPVLLTLVIELSIWINMGIPYFQGRSLMFLGYMIVSSIQLGATIDYAILLSDRYMALRRKLGKREAIVLAYGQSSRSILTSAVIFAVVGFSLGLFSKTGAVSAIGTLIGRGAVLSGLMVLVLLPQMLVMLDRIIMKTTLTRGKRL